jgi:hypothetical protein
VFDRLLHLVTMFLVSSFFFLAFCSFFLGMMKIRFLLVVK